METIKEDTKKVAHVDLDNNSNDDSNLVYSMEELGRWIEEARLDDEEGKCVIYNEEFRERIRREIEAEKK
ncbi:hypothetical protein [Candidatus Azobacteroides pseudotrichonymphae]|uniref:hypothetical protein n=1 Tax=Candidatus Azobacteroides pseudotrichonymphae TaxID=511435 RepID=UPI0002F7F123|nr:hypothetical protein [Candidatus Azobacteroides pseudotrichonymphae]